ncbi:hypothetical protein ACIBW9_34465 [Streptomyces sp. NPDC049541]|uniref:hypothetical protein n=1 Tax=Streptomyces sp. NPDC049541 TaxID=3365594 RepID=UPI0037967C4C
MLSLDEEGPDDVRAALRALLERCHSFCWATTLPFAPTPQGFRQRLLEMSVADQGRDARDMMVALNDLCGPAHDARIDIRPLLLNVAALSSDVDKYGMGSTPTASSSVVPACRTTGDFRTYGSTGLIRGVCREDYVEGTSGRHMPRSRRCLAGTRPFATGANP